MKENKTLSIVKKLYELREDSKSECSLLYLLCGEEEVIKMWNYLVEDFEGKDLHEYKNCKKIVEDLNFNFYLTKDFVKKYADILNWNQLCTWQKLDEDFLENFKDRVKWTTVLENQVVSEDFIRKHTNWFKHEHWYHLSMNKNLHFSEDFLREFKDKLEWSLLSDCYDFTKDFLREVSDCVYYHHFCYNNKTHLKENEICEFALGKDFEYQNEVTTVKDVMFINYRNKGEKNENCYCEND